LRKPIEDPQFQACLRGGVKNERKRGVAEKNEIIVYQPEGGEFHIEVRVENETVWLTQAQNRAKRVSQNQACLIL